ncbi:holin [Rhodococcus phage Shagrat]|nr:holin [Rhodococcus phage Shagrat]
MFTVKWAKDAAERAAVTFAEVLGSTIVLGTPLFDLDIVHGAAIAATATVLSLLKSVVATRVGDGENASLTR